jgi:hypothetical protein
VEGILLSGCNAVVVEACPLQFAACNQRIFDLLNSEDFEVSMLYGPTQTPDVDMNGYVTLVGQAAVDAMAEPVEEEGNEDAEEEAEPAGDTTCGKCFKKFMAASASTCAQELCDVATAGKLQFHQVIHGVETYSVMFG